MNGYIVNLDIMLDAESKEEAYEAIETLLSSKRADFIADFDIDTGATAEVEPYWEGG